ncbi:MAG: NAD(P)/FAD-dependent oxidoreductase [Deltaproteobacteria bacterium]|nr:NAD(P)/FAD-dependent oxidoreductase [Deltaproteobacteria bacterium]
MDTDHDPADDTATPGHRPRPWSKRVPADRGPFDTIVIGSGIGGMTTAALLARAGQRVLVLEQHYVPGGFTHAFRRKGFVWDVGVHLVGEMGPQAMPGRLMHTLTEGRLQWENVGPVYDTFHFPDGVSIQFPDNPTDFAKTLKAAFPASAAEIDAYLKDVRLTVRTMKGWMMGRLIPGAFGRAVGPWVGREGAALLNEPTDVALSKIVTDPKLRAVLTAQWGYHGSPPSEAAWALQCLVVRHFLWGAYFPVGGAQAIAPAMLQTVADHGGWTRICADVSELVLEGGRAVGVRMKDGEVIRAPNVVSAIGAWPTVTRLLPEAARAPWTEGIERLPPSPAHLALYLGFEGDIVAQGAGRSAEWFYNTWDHEEGSWRVSPDAPLPRAPALFTSYPSLKDPHHDPGPRQRHTGEIITFVPWDAFAKWQGTPWRKRGADYEAFKQRLTDAMLDELFQRHPGLKPLLVHAELGTPVSTDTFARPYHGAIYGLAGTPDRFKNDWLRPQSPIPGLYLSGSDVFIGGVVGAMMGGVLGAAAVKPIAVMRDLSAMR